MLLMESYATKWKFETRILENIWELTAIVSGVIAIQLTRAILRHFVRGKLLLIRLGKVDFLMGRVPFRARLFSLINVGLNEICRLQITLIILSCSDSRPREPTSNT